MENMADVGTQNQEPSIANQPAVVSGNHSQATSEKTFTQSDLDKITGRIRDETRQEYYDRGKRDASAEQKSSANQSMGGIEQISPEKISDMVENKVKEMANAEYGKQVVYEFATKMAKGKEKHPDFDDVVSQLNLPANPQFVSLVKDIENADEVMYELAKNPSKAANILVLGNTLPHLAQAEVRRLSDSIKKNADAKKQPSAREPLSQLNHSIAGTDNGSMTVKDLRKQPWLKA